MDESWVVKAESERQGVLQVGARVPRAREGAVVVALLPGGGEDRVRLASEVDRDELRGATFFHVQRQFDVEVAIKGLATATEGDSVDVRQPGSVRVEDPRRFVSAWARFRCKPGGLVRGEGVAELIADELFRSVETAARQRSVQDLVKRRPLREGWWTERAAECLQPYGLEFTATGDPVWSSTSYERRELEKLRRQQRQAEREWLEEELRNESEIARIRADATLDAAKREWALAQAAKNHELALEQLQLEIDQVKLRISQLRSGVDRFRGRGWLVLAVVAALAMLGGWHVMSSRDLAVAAERLAGGEARSAMDAMPGAATAPWLRPYRDRLMREASALIQAQDAAIAGDVATAVRWALQYPNDPRFTPFRQQALQLAAPAKAIEVVDLARAGDRRGVAEIRSWYEGSGLIDAALAAAERLLAQDDAAEVSDPPHAPAVVVEPPPTPAPSPPPAVTAPMGVGLSVLRQPEGASSGAPLAVAPRVAVVDAAGNVVEEDGDEVRVAIERGSGVTLGGMTSARVRDGVATFEGLSLAGRANEDVVLRFSAPGLGSVSAQAVRLAPGPGVRLAVLTQPSGAASGEPLRVAPWVLVVDAGGNTVTSDDDTVVRVSIAEGAGGALMGTTAVRVREGVARFLDLRLTGSVSEKYVLRFAADGYAPVTAQPMEVTAGVGARLAMLNQPSLGATGGVMRGQPLVVVVDSAGNTVRGDDATVVRVEIASGAAGSLSGSTAVRVRGGAAMFTDLALSGRAGETYVLRFVADGLEPVESSPLRMGG